jgi:hypothetical protein
MECSQPDPSPKAGITGSPSSATHGDVTRPAVPSLLVRSDNHDDWIAELARVYIEASLGIKVEATDRDGRQGSHDLQYKLDSRSVAVEVKAIVDEKLRQMDAVISRTGYVTNSQLTRLWVVTLRHGANVKNARTGLPDLLGEFERRGWYDHLTVQHARWAGFDYELERFGVKGLWSQEPTPDTPCGARLSSGAVGRI